MEISFDFEIATNKEPENSTTEPFDISENASTDAPEPEITVGSREDSGIKPAEDKVPESAAQDTADVHQMPAPATAERRPESAPESPTNSSDDEKRREHEENEARRKAEWEAAGQAKEDENRAKLLEISSMTGDEAMSASAKRLGDEAERLTRRNMKICVTEHIQTKCFDDPSFARLALHPRKSMINCFRYINRQAQDFLKKEAEETGENPVGGGYGGDVPDDLCYGWAEDYFRDPDAPEDSVRDEKFVPKPYYGGVSSQKPKSKKKEPAKPKPVPVPAKEPVHSDSAQQQLSLAEV